LSDPCGPYQSLQVGCVSKMTVLSGWYCYRREANGEHVWSQYPPKGGDFVMCTDVGNLPPATGTLCRDAGADTD